MTDTTTPAGKMYQPSEAAIEKLTLLTTSGQELELKGMMIELSYFEDLYGFVASGSLTIRDSQGLVEKLKLSGGEYLNIQFGRVKGAKSNVKKSFAIYKPGNRVPVGNLNAEFFTLHFCSEELFLSEQIKVQSLPAGKEISELVKFILTDKLKVKKKIDIEPTTGMYDFTGNTVKPLEAISWLSTYAIPASQSVQGADMLFFENKDGFNFKSLRTLFAQEPYNTYVYQQNNTTKDLKSKLNSVLQYDIVKSYDTLGSIASGAYASRLISVDPLTRSYKVTDFDYNKYTQENKPENGEGVVNDSTNRLGKTRNESYMSVVKVVVGNSEQYTVNYIKEKEGSVAKDIFIENTVPNRTAQIALANYTVLKIVVPGDPNLTVGKTINFNIYSLGINGDKKELDKLYSGKYLINATRHILQSQGVYQTVLEIAKESYTSSIKSVNETADLKEAKDE